MKVKTKKFSRKLLALFLAVVMALTCFTGVLTAYGAMTSSTTKYVDEAVEYNDLAWNVLSDEQVATALLDLADQYLPYLKAMEPEIAAMINDNSDINSYLKWDIDNRQIKVLGGLGGKFTVKLGSIDELIETINSVDSWLNSGIIDLIKSNFGDVAYLDLNAMSGMSRSKTSSCDILRGVVQLIQENTAYYSNANGESVIYNLLAGSFTLGSLDGALDVYGLIGGMLGFSDNSYKDDLVYNIVKSLLFNYTTWFDEEETLAYNGGGTLTLKDGSTKTVAAKTFVFDDVLLEKLSTELLQKISVLVTYNDGTSSKTRIEEINAYRAANNNCDYATAAAACGYDANLVYATEKGMENNVLLFVYGDNKLTLEKNDTLFTFSYRALKLAWDTVLKDTLHLVNVNYDVDRGHGSNFDNTYYRWAVKNGIEWDTNNLAEMYSAANVESWANAVYASYSATSADEFLGWVKHNLEHDRTIAEGAEGKWSDIDSSTLFNKLRYSPLADYYFNMQTGPINLYFVQTGTPHLDNFFANEYSNYTSIVSGFNDCLVAAVADIFPNSVTGDSIASITSNRGNIYVETQGDSPVPTMDKTGELGTIDDADAKTIANKLVGNALDIVQYVADTTDRNILNGFYLGGGTDLTEANLEEAMIPLLISCIGHVNLGSGKLSRIIHPADWDACKDAEAVAFVCLREYLSYILPSKDYNALITTNEDGSIKATLNGAILPMARDAVTYVMQGYVPVFDTEGAKWDVEDRAVNDSNTLLQLLNSVICYYADYYSFSDTSRNTDEKAMAVAPLLGVCANKPTSDGSSDVVSDAKGNSIWNNIDNVANDILPMLGELQGKGNKNFNSEDLIWNDIVLGVLDIGKTDIHTSGLGGVSNFMYRLVTIVSSDPVQSKSVLNVAYQLVQELINGLFGPRYSGQSYIPVPDALSESPFDSLITKNNFVGTSKSDPGALLRALLNLTEFAGCGSSGVHTYPDTLLPGLAFAVCAVNSFVTFLPSIGETSLKMASSSLDTSYFTGCADNTAYASTLTFTNENTGINVATVDGVNGAVEQLSRYYIRANSATISGPSSSSTITSPSSTLIAPGEEITLAVSAVFSAASGSSNVYTITVNYDIVDVNGNTLQSDLVSRTYQYLTSDLSWRETVYSRTGTDYNDNPIAYMPEAFETTSAGQTMTYGGYTGYSTPYFGKTTSGAATYNWTVNYPEYVVLSTDNLADANNLGVRVCCVRSGGINRSRSVDGIYYYDTGTAQNDMDGSTVTLGSAYAKPVFDRTTGDLLYVGQYDISYDGGATYTETGKTKAEVDSAYQALVDAEDSDGIANFTYRTHVAYTLEQAKKIGFLYSYHKNDRTGLYESVYLKSGSTEKVNDYATILSTISMEGPVAGFYLNTGKITISSGNTKYMQFLCYDGTTEVQGTTEPITMNMCIYNSSSVGTIENMKLVIGDSSATATIEEKLTEMGTIMANYRDTDFTGDALEKAQSAYTNGLAAIATPLTPTTAIACNDKTARQFITSGTDSATGDKAFVPATELSQIPESLQKYAYYNDANGIWYYDSELVAPIYVYTAAGLTDADVTDGKDAAGMPVTKNAEDGFYYHTNSVQYVRAWDTTDPKAPYYANTSVQAGSADGKTKYYNQVQFKHYNAQGKEVRYNDDWTIAVPQTSYQMIEGAENRGTYTKAINYLEWTIEYVYDHLSKTSIENAFNNVSLLRNGLNNNNFDVVSYNKMTNVARDLEKNYTIDVTYDYQKEVLDADGNKTYDADGNLITETATATDTIHFGDYNYYMGEKMINGARINVTGTALDTNLSSVQIDEYIRLFNLYMSKTADRGYQGKQIEAEILCASGNAYDAYTVTQATYDETGAMTAQAVINSTTATAKFGTYVDGVLTNADATGAQLYTDASWTAYVNALADAVTIAQLGNGSYAHKTADYYVAPTKDADGNWVSDYDARISACYYTDTALQAAEIALTPYVAEVPPETVTYNVSASLVVAKNANGVTDNVPVNGDYTITVYNATDDSVAAESTFAMSSANNTFSFDLAPGSYYATIDSQYAFARNATFTVVDSNIEGAVIPMIVCDYNEDGLVTVADAGTIFANSSTSNMFCDLNGDSIVSVADVGIVFACSSAKTLDSIEIA